MEKRLGLCQSCREEIVKHYCDACGNELFTGASVSVVFGYGSFKDGGQLEFCSDRCAILHLSKHYVKPWAVLRGGGK